MLCTVACRMARCARRTDYGAAAVILVGAVRTKLRARRPSKVDPALRQTGESPTSWRRAWRAPDPGDSGAALLRKSRRAPSARLAEPARTVMREVNARDLASLGPRLLPYIDELGADPALSPDRSPITTAPVFLLHGADDNVIPSTETPLLAAYLRAAAVPM